MFGFGPPLSSLILSHIYNVLLVSKASWGSKETFSRTWVGVQFKVAFNLGTEFFLCRIQTGWEANNLRILWQLNEWFSSGGSALDCVVCGLCIVITHNECAAVCSINGPRDRPAVCPAVSPACIHSAAMSPQHHFNISDSLSWKQLSVLGLFTIESF